MLEVITFLFFFISVFNEHLYNSFENLISFTWSLASRPDVFFCMDSIRLKTRDLYFRQVNTCILTSQESRQMPVGIDAKLQNACGIISRRGGNNHLNEGKSGATFLAKRKRRDGRPGLSILILIKVYKINVCDVRVWN